MSMPFSPLTFAATASSAAPAHYQPGAVERILQAIRQHLGMDVAFLSKVANGQVVIQHADPPRSTLLQVGDVIRAEDTYCQRIVTGRLPYIIHDAQKVPQVAHIAATRQLPIGAHISVPLRLSDGSIYGTFCSFSRTPDTTLNERDLKMLEAFAAVAAAQVEAELALSDIADGTIERLRQVLDEDHIDIALQPIYRLADRKVIGFEALARFADHGLRGPDAWFADAQRVGLGRQLELVAVRSALRAAAELPRSMYLAMNVSPDTLGDHELIEAIDEDARGRALVLEVTEHAVVEDYSEVLKSLRRLRGRARIAVDDAGAGYSGLRHILDLQPDMIKLDKSLTRAIDQDEARTALATALVSFGRAIGSQIIAEGVETAEECAALGKLAVDAAQGHYLCEPVPRDRVSRFLAAA